MAKVTYDIAKLLSDIKEKNERLKAINVKLNGSTTPAERKELGGEYNSLEYDREKLLEYLTDLAKAQ